MFDKASRIAFTLSCLQEGVRRGRAKAHADRIARQAELNLAAHWRG